MKTALRLSFIALAIVFLSSFANQPLQAQGKHPAYLHALSDLRDARAHLQRPDGGPLRAEENDAIHQIDEAINEIKHAAIDDGKNIDDHAPVDIHAPWAGRLHKAHDLLVKAHNDVGREEDNPTTRGLQVRVLGHIDRATHRVDDAIAIVDHH
ncbi:MAG: hypothetical protein WA211_21310 [Candidatus Acidiferrales bacterium]